MTTGIILIFCGFFLLLLPAYFTKIIAFILIGYGIYRIIKNANKRDKNYTNEARRTCDKAEPKQDKNATPPWEE